MKSHQNRLSTIVDILITLLVFVITFPRFEPVVGTGLDLSYTWAFNYLVHHDYNALTKLIYPIGPLGFLKYVSAFENNLLFGLACFSMVKISLIWLLLRLDFHVKGRHSIISVLLIIVAAYVSNFDFSIIGSTIVLLLLFNEKPAKYYLFLAAGLLALFGLFVKASIGITAFSAIFSYLLYALLSKKISLRYILMLLTACTLVFILGGSLVFKGFGSFINFLYGTMHLAGGYSSGLALHPENNWWLLSGFILSVLIIPFILKSKSVRLAFLVSLLPYFAMWKHAMGREDIYHIQLLIGFTLLMWAILFSAAKKYSIWFFILPISGLLLFYMNMKNVPQFDNYQINTAGFSNFNETILHYDSFNNKNKKVSEKAIKKQVLSKEIRKLIGKSTIDIYPWELSYIPANHLNWKPRQTLELGASTTNWLANKSAEHFTGIESPDFVIFQLINDKWGGSFGSLDGRYLLNDEPQLIFNLLNNYELSKTSEDFLLLKKMNENLNLLKSTIEREKVNWNEWVSIPKTEQGILRAGIKSNKNLFGKIKTFLYKDEIFFIDYKLHDGKMISYRFLPSNAKDGLWINPLIRNPFGLNQSDNVDSIRFRCSNYSMVDKGLELNWETIRFTEDKTKLLFFTEVDSTQNMELFNFHDSFEVSAKLIRSESISFSGSFAEIVNPDEFSTSFKISLDSIWESGSEKINIESKVMYRAKNKHMTKAMLVLSLQDSDNNFWSVFPFAENMIEEEWNYAVLRKSIDAQKHKSGTLKVYVWNKGNEKVIIDDLSLTGFYNKF